MKIHGHPRSIVSTLFATENVDSLTIVMMELDLRQAGSQQTSKSPTQRCCTVEEPNPVHQLMSPIEHREIDDHAAKQPSFAQAQEKPECQKPAVRLGQTAERRTKAPSDNKCGQIALETLDFETLAVTRVRLTPAPKYLSTQLLGTSTKMYGM